MVKPQPAGLPTQTWYWFGHEPSVYASVALGMGSKPNTIYAWGVP